MISTDSITCRIPSETAIKLQELTCSVANPVSSADSQTWAAWAGVVVALFAVLFARNAWVVSRKANAIAERNLKQAETSLESQLRETRTGIEKQIKAMNDLNRRQGELERMQSYLENLMRIAHSASTFKIREDGQSQFDYDKGELTISWGAWAAYLLGVDSELRNASSEMNTMLVDTADEVQKMAKMVKQNRWPEDELENLVGKMKEASLKQDSLFTAVGGYVAMVQAVGFRAEGYEKLRQQILENAEIARKHNQRGK